MEASAVVNSALILGGLGLVFGVFIALAQSKLRVWEDPRLGTLTEMLPGTNCGACGCPGCRGFAEALVGHTKQPAECTVMAPDDVVDVAEYLGVDAGKAHNRVARLLCAGGAHVAIQQAEYRGLETCVAAAAVAGGGKGCSWGCLGLADCEVVCDFDAIHMDRFGLPVVDPDKCTACNDCVEVCPKDLFVLMPITQKLIVQCRSELEGEPAELLCSVACTACGKCALDAASGVIQMENGLAVIDYEENERAGPEAITRCPTGAIVWVEKAQEFSATRSVSV